MKRSHLYGLVTFLGFIFASFLFVIASAPKGASPLPPIIKLKSLDAFLSSSQNVLEPQNSNLLGSRSSKRPVSRLILVGDVHGCFDSFMKLVSKLNFNSKKDELVLLGDFITKGDQNFEVLDYAIDHNLSCILGNHEVQTLQKYTSFFSYDAPKFCTRSENNTCVDEDIPDFSYSKSKYDQHLSIAKRLKQKHIDYLTNCSVILELGVVGYGEKNWDDVYNNSSEIDADDFSEINSDNLNQQTLNSKSEKVHLDTTKPIKGIAVHAGLQWHLNLTSQSVDVATNIRGLYKPDFKEPSYDSKNEVDENLVSQWSTIWNDYQFQLDNWNDRRIVYYGHESSRGLNLKPYTKGLDSGCFNNGKLSAMVIEKKQVKKKKGLAYESSLVQVAC